MDQLIYLFGIIAIIATLRVITHTKPVHALIYLIISLIAISCIFFLLGAYFAGALEIIIYAGAIMVLFIFVVMMLNISNYNKQEYILVHTNVWLYPSCVSLSLLLLIIYILTNVQYNINYIVHVITPKMVGNVLFGPYLLIVELASMLLLAGILVAFHLGHNYSMRDNFNVNCTVTNKQISILNEKRREKSI